MNIRHIQNVKCTGKRQKYLFFIIRLTIKNKREQKILIQNKTYEVEM